MSAVSYPRRVLPVLALLGLLTATGCGESTRDELQPPAAEPSTSLGQTPDTSSGPALRSDKFYDVTVWVDNRTNEDLRLVRSELGHESGSAGGHWDQRPVDVPARSKIWTSAYSAIQGQSISLWYASSSNGQPVSLRLVAQDPAIGSNNTNSTSVSGPMSVAPSIVDGRDCTATFVVTAPGS